MDFYTILIIEPNPLEWDFYRDLVSRFRRLRAEVIFAQSFEVGNSQISSSAVDVTFVRELKGEKKSLKFIRQLHAQEYLKPLFVITDSFNLEFENEAILAGASEILLRKDITPEIFERVSRFTMERYRFKKALLETESRFRGIFNASPQFMLLVNEVGEIMDVNRTALQKMELPSRTHIINRPLKNLPLWKSAHNYEYIVSDAFQSAKAGLESNFTIPLISRIGNTFQMKFSFKPFMDKSNTSCILVEGNDVTELKNRNRELEMKIQLRTRHLEESKRMAEEASVKLLESNHHRSRFLANMSHELRTPLNSILGFSDLLKGTHFGPLNEKQISYVNQIEKSGNHLLSLINDLLDLTKIDSGASKLNVQIFSPTEIIQGCLDMIQVQAVKKNLELFLEMDPELKELMADPQRFRQIMLNLLTNAVKYTEAGSIRVTSSVSEHGTVTFSVIDTGIGISAKDQAKVFNEFYQADRVRDERLGGTGIGLALTKRLVELHGGQIGLKSNLGEGSEFWFKIPKKGHQRSSSGTTQKLSAASLGISSKNAFLAVSDQQTLSILIELMQIGEYRNMIAQTEQELLELVNIQETRLIVLGLDISATKMDELIQKIKQMTVQSPVLMIGLISTKKSELQEVFAKHHVTTFLKKPFYASNFLGLIQGIEDSKTD